MRAPQIILCAIYGASLLSTAYLHGKPKEGKYSLPTALITVAIIFALLIWGVREPLLHLSPGPCPGEIGQTVLFFGLVVYVNVVQYRKIVVHALLLSSLETALPSHSK